MVELEFKVENSKAVTDALAAIEELTTYFHPTMRGWAEQTTLNYLWGMKNYPQQRPGSDYQRTGEFGESWSVMDEGPSHFIFESDHAAASLIVGDDQAWMHRGRWWRATERIEDRVDVLIQALEEALRKWPGR